jgi:cyclopropane-fatty-acyl-phospholipid synthase
MDPGENCHRWRKLPEVIVSTRKSISSNGRWIALTVSILDRVFPRPRGFNVRLWDSEELAEDSSAPFTLVLNQPGALRRMFSPSIELSLGEAFINKDFDIEGDIISAFTCMESIAGKLSSPAEMVGLLRDLLALPRGGASQLAGRGPVKLSGVQHSRQRDRAAIQYHYDVGNEFYALWLDRNMQYSCAYFQTGSEDLDLAQEQKMEHICRKLRLKPGERLLDIGCGWGGLARYAARKYGVQVLGVTLSERQAQFANKQSLQEGLENQVEIQLLDYRDLASGAFDKIVSVGMFEHVGRDHLPEYFDQVYRLLKPGGLFLNHGIAQGAQETYRAGNRPMWQKLVEWYILGSGLFMQRYIFPDGELVPVSEANLIAERAGFEVRDVENLREHYALTLRHWVARLNQCQAEAVRASDEKTYRTWRIYMSASAYGFERGNINVNQTLLARPDGGCCDLPLTRADLYAFD